MTGEKIVLRLFDNAGIQALDELGFAAEARAELERFLRRKYCGCSTPFTMP